MTVFLNGLATAVPDNELPQTLALEIARRIMGPKYPQFERIAGSFSSSGVEKRYSMAPLGWFEAPKSWPERNSVYLEQGKALFIKVAQAALQDAGLDASDIDAVVTVSSTGIATPTLEALAFKELGFRNDIQRVPVFGLGCAGGVSGLSIARDLAAARHGTNVLMVSLEACTLSFRTDRLQKADIIATILFGDGAAAAVLSSEQTNITRKITVSQGCQHLWDDTLGIMGWDVDDSGLGVIFDRSIPAFTLDNFADAVQFAFQKSGAKREELARFVCHPGGKKVVEAIETALQLPAESLDAERDTLRDYGNMSAPTALFVLKRVLENGAKGKMMMTALGPGFTASFLPLEVVS